MMKRTELIVLLIVSILCWLPAQAQFGGLFNKGKEKVENKGKKNKGNIDFYFLDKHRGYYDSQNRIIVFDDTYQEGELTGQRVTFTIMDNGTVIRNDGKRVGELLDNGVVNCHDCAPYLTTEITGDVVMDGEVIGHIDNITGVVSMEGFTIANVKGIDKQIAAYIIFGIIHDKERIAYILPKYKEERKRVDEEKKNAQRAQNSSGKNVQEWTIEKNGNRGFVDANGVVYNWSHKKIGQLPKGSGDIKDADGNKIGSIDIMGVIFDRNGRELATVRGGSISIPGSNATVAEVRAAGRIDTMQGPKTLGYCDARPYVWAVAIIFCDFFRF